MSGRALDDSPMEGLPTSPLAESIVSTIGRARPRSVALVHDWLTGYAGGERVLEQIIALYPEAPIFTTIDVLPSDQRDFLGGRVPITTFAQRWPGIRGNHRVWLPLLMLAVEQLDVRESELVLSTSASVGKGVLTTPDQLHVAYVHSPMRYAWDLQHEYLQAAGLDRGFRSLLARWMLHKARLWDLRTANGVDHFIANSKFIAARIGKVYRRAAHVVYPPVDTQSFVPGTSRDEFYLVASRLVPYKQVPAIVAAFRGLPDRTLVVIGDGPERGRVRSAAGRNVELIGYQPQSVLRDHLQRAKAVIVAAEEDFGIATAEAQACGIPVIAFARGGSLEIVRDPRAAAPTGLFFERRDPASIASAIREFERSIDAFSPLACRENALRFSIDAFRESYARIVNKCWDEFRAGGRATDGLLKEVST